MPDLVEDAVRIKFPDKFFARESAVISVEHYLFEVSLDPRFPRHKQDERQRHLALEQIGPGRLSQLIRVRRQIEDIVGYLKGDAQAHPKLGHRLLVRFICSRQYCPDLAA